MVFPFYSLPPEAREMVLEYVDVETKLNMMRINYNLREYVLKNGPFPKNVDFMFVATPFNTLRNGKIFARILKLRIECGREYNFIVRKIVKSTSKVLRDKRGNLLLKPSHLGIFKNIKFPKSLELRFDFDVGDEEILAFLQASVKGKRARSSFGLERFLSNFRFLQKLSLSFDEVRIANAVFKNFKPSVLGPFDVQFDVDNEILPELDFYTENFRSYVQNQLAECAVIYLPCLPTSAISFLEAFSQTNVKEFCFENIGSPVEAVKFILNNGIPSKCDEAAILFSGVIDVKREIKSMMLKAAGMTVIHPDSWAGMKAIERCLYISDEDNELNGEIKMKPDYIFERQLSSAKKCTYLLKYVYGRMEFVAKNSAIVF